MINLSPIVHVICVMAHIYIEMSHVSRINESCPCITNHVLQVICGTSHVLHFRCWSTLASSDAYGMEHSGTFICDMTHPYVT